MCSAVEIFERTAEDAFAKGNWSIYLDTRRHLDADGGVSAIRRLPSSVPDTEYCALVLETWSWGNRLWEYRDAWRAVFAGTTRKLVNFSSPSAAEKLIGMPNPLAIFRGCVEHNQLGFAWTIDRERAEYYACFTQGHTGAPRRFISSGNVEHAKIIAYIDHRNEEEILVFPENVTEIQLEDISHRPVITEAMMKQKGKAIK